jgi:hypothetical protein
MVSTNKIIQTSGIDLWEAWIDTQTIGASQESILYVVGEFFGTEAHPPRLVRKRVQPQPFELHLELVLLHDVDETTEVYYSEVLTNYCPYQEVIIYMHTTIIARMDVENTETPIANYNPLSSCL